MKTGLAEYAMFNEFKAALLAGGGLKYGAGGLLC